VNGIPDAAESYNNHACDNDTDTLWDLEYATLIVHLFNGITHLNDGVDGKDYRVDISNYGMRKNTQHAHVPPHVNVDFRLRSQGTGGTIAGPTYRRAFNKGEQQPDEQAGPGNCGAGSYNNHSCDNDGDTDWDLEYATLNVHLFNGTTDLNDGVSGKDYRVSITNYGTRKNGDRSHVPPHVNVDFRLRTQNGGTIAGPTYRRAFNKGEVQPDEQAGPGNCGAASYNNHACDNAGDLDWDLEYATV